MNEIDLLTNNFSAQRLGKYLRLYAGDDNKAVAHYKANLALAESLYTSLSVFEVTLRNALSNRMEQMTGIHDRLVEMLGWLDKDMPKWLNEVDRFNEVCESIMNSPDGLKVK